MVTVTTAESDRQCGREQGERECLPLCVSVCVCVFMCVFVCASIFVCVAYSSALTINMFTAFTWGDGCISWRLLDSLFFFLYINTRKEDFLEAEPSKTKYHLLRRQLMSHGCRKLNRSRRALAWGQQNGARHNGNRTAKQRNSFKCRNRKNAVCLATQLETIEVNVKEPYQNGMETQHNTTHRCIIEQASIKALICPAGLRQTESPCFHCARK